jgi:hypothetical protein
LEDKLSVAERKAGILQQHYANTRKKLLMVIEQNRFLKNKVDNDASYYSQDEHTGHMVKKKRVQKKIKRRTAAEIEA